VRCAAALWSSGRAGHWAYQGRAPDGPQSSQGRDGSRPRRLKAATATASNAVLAAAGYNFGLLLRWLERPLSALIAALLTAPCSQTAASGSRRRRPRGTFFCGGSRGSCSMR
jgi:hypothetical protein